MQIIKISQPKEWENKINLTSPQEKGIWGNYKFIITSENIECDYWIVLGDLNDNETAKCNEENVIFITDEAHVEKTYNQSFLNQFSTVITSREDIKHSNLILAPYMCAWFILKNFDFLVSFHPNMIKKSKIISVVSSNLTVLEGHKNRFAFVNKMIGHFKKRMDVYGKGFNEVKDKYDALIDYKYSIAIENSNLPRYFSEKIVDCFLTYTMPIYYGCTNILEYFPREAMINIDINNYEESIEMIEEGIFSDRYLKNFDFLVEARKIYFDKFHQLQAITTILDKSFSNNNSKKLIELSCSKSFEFRINKNVNFLNKCKQFISKHY